MLSIPFDWKISCCVVHHRRFLNQIPFTTPQERGSGNSTSAKTTDPQNATIAQRYVSDRPKVMARPSGSK